MLSEARLTHLFLALFEAPEVVLYEERGVELADCHVILLGCSHITKHTHETGASYQDSLAHY